MSGNKLNCQRGFTHPSRTQHHYFKLLHFLNHVFDFNFTTLIVGVCLIVQAAPLLITLILHSLNFTQCRNASKLSLQHIKLNLSWLSGDMYQTDWIICLYTEDWTEYLDAECVEIWWGGCMQEWYIMYTYNWRSAALASTWSQMWLQSGPRCSDHGSVRPRDEHGAVIAKQSC